MKMNQHHPATSIRLNFSFFSLSFSLAVFGKKKPSRPDLGGTKRIRLLEMTCSTKVKRGVEREGGGGGDLDQHTGHRSIRAGLHLSESRRRARNPADVAGGTSCSWQKKTGAQT